MEKQNQNRALNVLGRLKKMGRKMTVEAWAREGVPAEKAVGVPIPDLKSFAKKLGQDHDLALALWDTEIHDARLLAALMARPEKLSASVMDSWTYDFNSMPLCDHVCFNLFNRCRHAWTQIPVYAAAEKAYVRRAAFSLIWTLATHSKAVEDEVFLAFLPAIEAAASDERDEVGKAVDLALRAVGKRSLKLNEAARALALDLFKSNSLAASKIGDRALRELETDAVQRKFQV